MFVITRDVDVNTDAMFLQVDRLKVVLSNTEDVTLLAKKKQLAAEVARVVDRATHLERNVWLL